MKKLFFIRQFRFGRSMDRLLSNGFSFRSFVLGLRSIVYGLLSLVLFPIPSHAQEELRDVRPPIEVSEFPWLWVIVALVIVAVLIKLTIDWKNRPKAIIFKDPWIVAGERLDALQKQSLASKGEFKAFFTELSTIIRNYLEQRFNIRAPEMTTQEFLESMKNSTVLLEQHKEILKELLQTADMVKFARHQPDAERSVLCFDLARRLVNETKPAVSNGPAEKTKTRKF